ncbi:MAG: hypothetical protein ACYC2T_07220 [Bacillota bacterium]
MRSLLFIITRNRLLRVLAVILLGFILGCTVTTALIAHQIDKLALENQKLQVNLEATREELNQVKENLASQRSPTVTSIESHVKLLESNFSNLSLEATQLALEDIVRDTLQPLKGREITSLDTSLIPQIINHRVVEAEGSSFSLRVTLLIISQKLQIYVNATPKRVPQQIP